MFAPCAIAPFYGRLLWLNRDGRAFPGMSTRAAFMVGAGGHYVGMDPELDAVIVLRWLDPVHAGAALRRIASALTSP
jgi:acyl dehydratase